MTASRTVENALPPKAIRRVWEPVLKRILASRLHGMMSGNLMLIHVTGRKSGKVYILPVPYLQTENRLVILAAGVWWKNLRGGAPVEMRLRGRMQHGYAEVYEQPDVIRDEVRQFLKQRPQVARFLRIALDEQGNPDAAGMERAAAMRVIVRVQLTA